MRHRKAGRKLGMDSSERQAMFRNMVTSLLLHGQVKTTEARAKELRRYAERVITIGKHAPTKQNIDGLGGDERQAAEAARVHAIRKARLWVHDDEALSKLFGEYAERFRVRPGGYTRVVKTGRRDGDNAKMAVIQLVEAYVPGAEAAEPGDEAEAQTKQTAAQADLEATEVIQQPEE